MYFLQRALIAAAVAAALAAGIAFGPPVQADRAAAVGENEDTMPWEEARLLAEVFERVKRDYVESVSDRELVEAAVRGVLSSLDPHSAFLDEEAYREMRITTSGHYAGVGVEVSLRDGMVIVVSPIDDTPAHNAGIEPGDVIVMVDGESVDPDDLDATIERMRGEAGSIVNLSVTRSGVDEILDFSLTRTDIAVKSVRANLLEPGIGYVRISQFSETTGAEMTASVLSLQDENGGDLDGLVLDLRNNPGGLLDAAVSVSDSFLQAGKIVSADGRIASSNFAFDAHPGDISNNAQLVVLVNAGSASASEIVAGALQDNGRATIMGDVTYGKGSVQTIVPLTNERAIKLTTSKYFTPSGRSIHGFGIKPDVSLTGKMPADFLAGVADAKDLPMQQRDFSIAQAVAAIKRDGSPRHSQATP